MRLAPVTLTEVGPLGRWRLRVVPAVWEWLALAVLLGVALTLRLVGIGQDTDISDEGIRGIQLRLMAAGYRPVSEIYASQGPLSLTLFYPFYRLFGGEIVAARLAVVAYSVLSLLAVFAVGRAVGGGVVGLAAVGLLAVSPSFVENSRLAFVEVPSLAPALWGLALLVRWRGTGRRWPLVASAILVAVAALAKPMAGVAGLGALALIAATGGPLRARAGAAALYAAVGLATVGLVVLATGPAAIYEQLVAYRLAAREARGWELGANWSLIQDVLGRESVAVVGLAAVGALALLPRRPAEAAALVAWLAGGLALLLVYAPLWPKHVVYLIPPLAILAGVAIAECSRIVGAAGSARRSGLLPGLAVLGLGAYLVSLPAIAAHDRRLADPEAGRDAERFAADLRVVSAATRPDDFIVMDDAYLAASTGRLVPPHLADLSWNRLRARALSPERAIAETERFRAAVVIVQDDHLGQIPRYLNWLDREYLLVSSYVQRRPARFRRVYVRRDVDLAAVRSALAPGIETPFRAEIGPIALLGYTLERRDLKTGSRFGLTLHWEALDTSPPEHQAVVRLRGGDGAAVHESTWRIGEGTQEIENWAMGGWQMQTIRVLLEDDLQPGAYTLTLGLDRPGIGLAAIDSAAGIATTTDRRELDLGTVTVR